MNVKKSNMTVYLKEDSTEQKKEKNKMKKINWKHIGEKAKSITLIIIFTGAIAFYAGMRYQSSLDAHTSHKVSEAVKAAQVSQVSKQ